MPPLKPLHWKTLEKVFLKSGFRFLRQTGSHRAYGKAGIIRPVLIPAYDEVPVAIIAKNLKTAGISREEFFKLIQE